MTLNRQQTPERHPIASAELIKPEALKLDNGIPFFALRSGSQPVLRLEFIYDAGIRKQDKILSASFTNSMLTEGTASMSAQALAEAIDFYGAFIQPEIDNDRAGLTLHCLTRVFHEVAPLVAAMLQAPTFPEKELETNLSNAKQKFIVNSDKVEFLARKQFTETLFGPTHPYGKQASAEDFDLLTTADIKGFFERYYHPENLTIIASGQFGDEVFEEINRLFGKTPLTHTAAPNTTGTFVFPAAEKVNIPKENALQCGIRIGKILFNKTHPEFVPMQVLNTALGGYFGSRLMANIREDKGYTYGIGSAMVSLQDTGYFFIATEVGAEVAGAALKEIYHEIQRLREEPIPAEELEMVKNYMLGSFLRNSEGPFAMADRFKSTWFYGLDYTHYERYIHTINAITAEKLQNLAHTFLDPDTLTEVVAGNFKRN